MSNLVPNIDLISPCGPSLGGLAHIRLIHNLDVEFILDPIRWPTDKPYTIGPGHIKLKPNAAFADIFFHINKANFSEPESQSPNGSTHRQAIGIFIPQDREDVANWYYLKQNQKFVALYADGNERYRLIGTPDNPASINLDSAIGSRYSDPNGYIFTISAQSVAKAFYVEDIIDDIQFPNITLPFAFNLGFFA